MRVRAEAEPDGKWWAVTIPDVAGGIHTQAKRLSQVPHMVADAVSLMTEEPHDSIEVDVVLDLPAEVRAHLEAARRLREEAARAQHEAAEESRAAARALAAAGLTLRDIGTALGISHQRAHQLVG